MKAGMTCSQNENSRLAGSSPMLICQATISHDNDGTLASNRDWLSTALLASSNEERAEPSLWRVSG